MFKRLSGIPVSKIRVFVLRRVYGNSTVRLSSERFVDNSGLFSDRYKRFPTSTQESTKVPEHLLRKVLQTCRNSSFLRYLEFFDPSLRPSRQ